jgi:hypothetical protein
MRSLVLTALICALLYVGLALGLQRHTIYPRPAAFANVPAVPGLELLQLGDDEAVEAFFLPAYRREGLSPGPALIFAHGNGELIDMWAQAFETPRRWGVAVLLVEYPGYGRSGGSPSEASIGQVFEEAYEALSKRAEIDGSRIVGYGRSLGGGAVCGLSRKRELAALILESTFTSLVPLARRMLIMEPLLLDRFDNLAAVEDFSRPVLILHGRADRLIPRDNADALHAAASDSQLHLMQCGHNDCPQRWDLIRPFLRQAGVLHGWSQRSN